jgi:hypothetical protein
VLTPFAIVGLVLLYRERVSAAAACLAIYSISGLIGLGHYMVPGVGELPWWRHAHIFADIACGVAIVVSAVWLRRRFRPPGRTSAKNGVA